MGWLLREASVLNRAAQTSGPWFSAPATLPADGLSQLHPTSPACCPAPGLGGRTHVSVGRWASSCWGCSGPPMMFLLSQVLLAWSGGPSSSSMVWQVLEVRLHTVLLGPGCCPAELEGGGRAPRGSCLGPERAASPPLGCWRVPGCVYKRCTSQKLCPEYPAISQFRALSICSTVEM